MATSPEIVLEDVTFSADEIRDCSVVEDFNPFSITVPINTLDLTLYSTTGGFTIINPLGTYESLLSRKPMAVYEIVDGVRYFIGQYFLDEWENESENLIRFSCIDALGLLDKEDYKGGIWLTPVQAGVILEDIFNQVGISANIDPQVYATELTGWLPISTCREALQQVCFAAGAYVKSTRQESVKVGVMGIMSPEFMGIRCGVGRTGQSRTYQMRWRGKVVFLFSGVGVVTQGIRSGVAHAGQTRNYQKRWRKSQWEGTEFIREVSAGEQSSDRKLTLRSQVTGVEVSMHDIVEGDGEQNLYEGTLSAGEHEIQFSQPMHTLAVTGATIIESGANYAILDVASEGEVTLLGLVYEDTVSSYGVYLDEESYEKRNVLKIEEATLVNSTNGRAITQRIYDYYQQRYQQKMKLFGSSLSAGNSVKVETLYGNLLYGVIEHADVDLAGGFIVNADVIGVIV